MVNFGGNCGTGVRASISKHIPLMNLGFEKNNPFIYLIVRNVDLFIYCTLIFIPFLPVVTQIWQACQSIPECKGNRQPRKIFKRYRDTIYRDVRKV